MHQMKRFTVVTLWITLVTILAMGTSASAQEESRELKLTPSRNSGVSGTATFTDTKGGVEVRLNIQGAPEGEHLAHIHEDASCQDDRNDEGGPVEFPLESIETTSDGKGSSTTTIEGTTVAKLFDGSKKRYVNVHAKAEDSGVPPGIACADLTVTAGGESTTGERTTGGPLPGSGGTSLLVSLATGASLILGAMVLFLALRRAST